MNQPEITTKNGLLFLGDKMLEIQEADAVAKERGFNSAESLVRHLEKVSKSREEK